MNALVLENRLFNIRGYLALRPLVSLFWRLVASNILSITTNEPALDIFSHAHDITTIGLHNDGNVNVAQNKLGRSQILT